jgi:hypothetical protein
MSFVPVYLRQPRSAIQKSDAGDTLPFSPATASIEFAQSPNFSNGRADSKGLGMGDFSNNLEFHQILLSKHRDVVKPPSSASCPGSAACARLAAAQSALIPASRTTLAYLADSDCMSAANCSGVPGAGDMP